MYYNVPDKGEGGKMGKDSTIYIRIEEGEKRDFERLASSLGMTPSGAVRLFIKKALAMKAIPFRVGLPEEKDGGDSGAEDYESLFK
jgi:addiction module RelB/DinJ family antitoxin